MAFRHEIDGCLAIDENKPESAIAYDEDIVRSLYAKYGFDLKDPIRYGSWCGRSDFLSYQDIVLAGTA